MSLLPEVFEADESSLEQMIVGSDLVVERRLEKLSDQLSPMALWHEQKAQMLHTAAIRLALHLGQRSNDLLH